MQLETLDSTGDAALGTSKLFREGRSERAYATLARLLDSVQDLLGDAPAQQAEELREIVSQVLDAQDRGNATGIADLLEHELAPRLTGATDPQPSAQRADFVRVACQVCGSSNAESVYERDLETASFGRVHRTLLICEPCGFLYASPRPSRAALARHYRDAANASGAVWHDTSKDGRFQRLTEQRRKFIEPFVSKGVPGRVLDVGCSQGDLLAALELPGWDRVGLEPSTTAADRARARGLTVVEELLDDTTLEAESFDLVTCTSVLEHVWDVRESLAALERLVAPGGLLFLSLPDSTRPVAHVAEYFSFEHLSHFSAGSATRLLIDFGMRPLALEKVDGSSLFICARKESRSAVADVQVPDDRAELRAAVHHYRDERTAFEAELRERFESLATQWREEGQRVGIYGAGEHTTFLLELIDIGEQVVAVFDSDESRHGQHFLRWPIHAPEQASELDVDVVLISSRPFQEEMYARIAHFPADLGIEVLRCYAPSTDLI